MGYIRKVGKGRKDIGVRVGKEKLRLKRRRRREIGAPNCFSSSVLSLLSS